MKNSIMVFRPGMKVKKISGKPFKSGNKIGTVKDMIVHPITLQWALLFEEDDSYVEAKQCEVAE